MIAMLLLRNCKSKNLLKKTLLAQKDAHLKHLIIYGKEKAQQVFKIAYFSVPRIEDPVHLSFITLFLQPVFLIWVYMLNSFSRKKLVCILLKDNFCHKILRI